MTKKFNVLIVFTVALLSSCNNNSEQNTAEKELNQPDGLISINTDSVDQTAIEIDTQKIEPEALPVDSMVNIEESKDISKHTSKDTVEKVSIENEKKADEVNEEIELDDGAEEPEEMEVANLLPDHDAWNTLMIKYVTEDGKVNYAGLKKEKPLIENYISTLVQNGPKNNWSHNVRLAFWINLYNAVTVNLILDNYPLKSIMDINKGKAWDLKLINIDDTELSLNDIEHNIIRKRFSEPRIHFAVNCAAKSCPKLLNTAFLPETLDRQLELQTSFFIHNTDKNHISSENIELSRIFDWYASDFGDIKIFIKKYEPAFDTQMKFDFLEYNWALNE